MYQEIHKDGATITGILICENSLWGEENANFDQVFKT